MSKYEKQTMTFDATLYMNGELNKNPQNYFSSQEKFVDWIWDEFSWDLTWKCSVANGLVEQFEGTNPNFDEKQREAFGLLKQQVANIGATVNKIHGTFNQQRDYVADKELCLTVATLDLETKEIDYDIVSVEEYVDFETINKLYDLDTSSYLVEKIKDEMIVKLADAIEVDNENYFNDLFNNVDSCEYSKNTRTDNVAFISKDDGESIKFICFNKNLDGAAYSPICMTKEKAYEIRNGSSEEDKQFVDKCEQDILNIVNELGWNRGGQ